MSTLTHFRPHTLTSIFLAFFIGTTLSPDVSAARGFEGKAAEIHTIQRRLHEDLEFARTHSGRSRIEESFYQQQQSRIKYSVTTTNPPRTHELIGEGLDGIHIRLPSADLSRHDQSVIDFAKKELAPLRENVDLASLYIINVANDIGSTGMYKSKIPRTIQHRSAAIKNGLESLSSGSDLYDQFVKLPAGSVVVIFGHIDEYNGTLLVEKPEKSLNISVLRLLGSAEAAHINLIFLGCNSSSAAPVGTTQPIDSVKVIQEFGDFVSSRDPLAPTSLGQLYVAAAKAVGGLLINPYEYKAWGMTPIIRKNGEVAGTTFGQFSYGPCKPPIAPYNLGDSVITRIMQKAGLRLAGSLTEHIPARPRCSP